MNSSTIIVIKLHPIVVVQIHCLVLIKRIMLIHTSKTQQQHSYLTTHQITSLQKNNNQYYNLSTTVLIKPFIIARAIKYNFSNNIHCNSRMIIDTGDTRHITGYRYLFINHKRIYNKYVTLGDRNNLIASIRNWFHHSEYK